MRDIVADNRDKAAPERARSGPERHPESWLSREHDLVRVRGYLYRLSARELETMRDVGRFRTVAMADLVLYRYQGKTAHLDQDVRSLRTQGLVQPRTVWNGPRSKKLAVVVLTKLGKQVLQQLRQGTDQAIYSGLVKPAEVRHDAAIYRMYQAEKEKIEHAGGHLRRVILDYELKRKVYSPLAKAKGLPPAEYAKRQLEVARENSLTVIRGKVLLPDLRIEYVGSTGESLHVDLELATSHYHGPALQAKAEAGFKMYAADGSSSRLGRVLEERGIIASILSL